MLRLERLEIRRGAFELRVDELAVADGEYLVVLGSSGAGKTALLETLAGHHPPRGGRIAVDGLDLTGEAIQRRPMVLVHQEGALFPHLSAARNVLYPLAGRGLDRATRQRRLAELAALTGIGGLLARRPAALSGGERQRVALARALARSPRYLLLDEPLSSLDCDARAGLRALLRRLNRSGLTVLHVTHDFEEALGLAGRVAVLEDGRVAQSGEPLELFRHPRCRFMARFAGVRNILRGRLEAADRDGLPAGRFLAGERAFDVDVEGPAGAGSLLIRGEDVHVLDRLPPVELPNLHRGRVVDLAPAREGIEIGVDIGVPLVALLDAERAARLALRPGGDVGISVGGAAARFLPEER